MPDPSYQKLSEKYQNNSAFPPFSNFNFFTYFVCISPWCFFLFLTDFCLDFLPELVHISSQKLWISKNIIRRYKKLLQKCYNFICEKVTRENLLNSSSQLLIKNQHCYIHHCNALFISSSWFAIPDQRRVAFLTRVETMGMGSAALLIGGC